MRRLYGHGTIAFLNPRAAGRPALLLTVVGAAARGQLEQSLLISPAWYRPGHGRSRGPERRPGRTWSGDASAARHLACWLTQSQPRGSMANIGHVGLSEGIRDAPDAFGDAHQGGNRG